MKQTPIFVLMLLLFVACGSNEKMLKERAEELCKYIPDHDLIEGSQEYITADFYAVLDTMFNHLHYCDAMDHEWLFYFVTGNGGTIADYEVAKVERLDDDHALANIIIRQKWDEDPSSITFETNEHQMLMQRENGVWLMADFDNHKQDCIQHISLTRI